MKKSIMLMISILIAGTILTSRVANGATILKVGSYGSDVKILQTNLTTLGYSVGAIDGIFGQMTRSAVISFQNNAGLLADGIVGPLTYQALDWAIERKSITNGILAKARGLIGVPYVWGGTSPSGFDCSGFTQYVFASQGITIPRTSINQYSTGSSVAFNSLRPGDLVFFSLSGNGIVSHVGIYIGNGQFINATTSKGVTISSFSPYWMNIYVGAKRVY